MTWIFTIAHQGAVIRADVHADHATGRPKGSGIVAFESPVDARNAIDQFNGYDWQGRILEVRLDRLAPGGFGPPMANRGDFHGPPRDRGGFQNRRGDFGPGGRGGYPGGGFNQGGAPLPPDDRDPVVYDAAPNGEKSDTIFVRNVSHGVTRYKTGPRY